MPPDGDPARAEVPAGPAPSSRPQRRLLLRLYGRLHDWAESGWSRSAVAAWGAMQGSVVPGPADLLLAPLGLADPRRAFPLAAWATLGATLGGVLAYIIGAEFFDTVGRQLLTLFGVSDATVAASRALFEQRAWLAVAIGALTPIPSKFMSMFAGAFGMPFGEFLVTIAVARAVHFTVVAALIRLAGERLREAIDRRFGRAARPV
jgi:membrane protein YqaA with SNARE-associated domain